MFVAALTSATRCPILKAPRGAPMAFVLHSRLRRSLRTGVGLHRPRSVRGRSPRSPWRALTIPRPPTDVPTTEALP